MSQALVAGSLAMNCNMQFTCTNIANDTSVQTDPGPINAFSLIPSDATLFYHGQTTIAISSNLTLTLSALTDKFGGAIAFATVYGFLIQNMNTVSGNFVTVGAAAVNPFVSWTGGTTPTIKVNPSGAFFLSCALDGYAAAATVSDQLKIANPSAVNTVTVKYTIIGK